jgi:hypothetical protein
MQYPVDRQIFGELSLMRDRMVLENPKPDHVGIARPFLPWIGEGILEGAPGIYFFGIATRGTCDELKSFTSARELAKTWALEISTPFWQYIREVVTNVYGREYSKCISRIAWSNQYKIGVFNLNGPTSLNPKGFYSDVQVELCEKIMKRELQLASACAVVFLGDGTPLDRVLGDEWDKDQYKQFGMWTKDLPGGSPVFYQYHPGWLRRQGARHFDEHAHLLACAIRGRIVSHA